MLQTIPADDMGAFRSGPDVHDEVRRLVPKPDRLQTALLALTNDADPDIRARALELRAGVAETCAESAKTDASVAADQAAKRGLDPAD
jgi:hypothetical protein